MGSEKRFGFLTKRGAREKTRKRKERKERFLRGKLEKRKKRGWI